MCTVPPASVYSVEKYVEDALLLLSTSPHWGRAEVVDSETVVDVTARSVGAAVKDGVSVSLKTPIRNREPEMVPGDGVAVELVMLLFSEQELPW